MGGPLIRNPPQVVTLRHTTDLISSFSLLSLTPPANSLGVEASVAELEEKRAYYDTLPRAPKGAKQQKKKKSKPSKPERKNETSDERFPELPKSVTPKTSGAAIINGQPLSTPSNPPAI